jgi:hypothetical protein
MIERLNWKAFLFFLASFFAMFHSVLSVKIVLFLSILFLIVALDETVFKR